jgi:phosphoribosylformimino-5-aminoimidazole carboxamide ribotide isomerase
LLFTNIDVEGLMQGIEPRIVEAVVNAVSLPVVVAGGVSSVEDVQRIKAAGARGVVIGSALYTGKIDFKDLMESYND